MTVAAQAAASQVDTTSGAPGAASYSSTQATTPSWWDTIVTDVEDPVNHPIVFMVGALVVAGLLFVGSSKPKKKPSVQRPSRSITIKD